MTGCRVNLTIVCRFRRSQCVSVLIQCLKRLEINRFPRDSSSVSRNPLSLCQTVSDLNELIRTYSSVSSLPLTAHLPRSLSRINLAYRSQKLRAIPNKSLSGSSLKVINACIDPERSEANTTPRFVLRKNHPPNSSSSDSMTQSAHPAGATGERRR